ncbi:hypothetical protein F5146DRAFT_1030746 [Armillaria mellea]|nr:hypothetical protein F5146DRAFT_1030746 [Armillaria mellea]
MSVVPALRLPALDNTLGALYIGASLSTLLYGAICVQTFFYITSNRVRSDRWWLKLLVFIIALDTISQGMLLAGMYQYLVSDFANPAAFAERGASSGAAYEEAIVGACSMLLVQLYGIIYRQFGSFIPVDSFFCWRIWTFSASSLNLWPRIIFVAFTTLLAFLNFANSIFGFRPLLTSRGPGFFILSLHRARSGRRQSDHVITLLTLFTVNTNLITTSFVVFPNAAIYGGISLLLGKSYLNTFLAILNAREYLREKLDPSMSIPEAQSSHPVFAEPTVQSRSPSADGLPTEV